MGRTCMAHMHTVHARTPDGRTRERPSTQTRPARAHLVCVVRLNGARWQQDEQAVRLAGLGERGMQDWLERGPRPHEPGRHLNVHEARLDPIVCATFSKVLKRAIAQGIGDDPVRHA